MARYDKQRLREDIVFSTRLRDRDLTFHSRWGLFSPRGIDAGTRLLIEQIEIRTGDHCLDLGCGYGPIGILMARIAADGRTTLVDKDFVAVEYAEANAKRNGVSNFRALLSDGFSAVPAEQQFDLVASNLPAKAGNEAYYVMFREAHEHLREGGRFYVVTLSAPRRFIERAFTEVFGNYKKVKQGRAHTVSMAVKEG